MEVDVPVMVVGGIRSPEMIGHLLETTGIEYFSPARPLLTEPKLPERWEWGDRSPVKCTFCNGCSNPKPKGSYPSVMRPGPWRRGAFS